MILRGRFKCKYGRYFLIYISINCHRIVWLCFAVNAAALQTARYQPPIYVKFPPRRAALWRFLLHCYCLCNLTVLWNHHNRASFSLPVFSMVSFQCHHKIISFAPCSNCVIGVAPCRERAVSWCHFIHPFPQSVYEDIIRYDAARHDGELQRNSEICRW